MATVEAIVKFKIKYMPTERECTEDGTSLFEVVEDEIYEIQDEMVRNGRIPLLSPGLEMNLISVERISDEDQ